MTWTTRLVGLSWLLLLAAGALSVGSGGCRTGRRVALRYIPLPTETLYAISPETIDDYARYQLELAEGDPALAQLRSLLASGRPGTFDQQVVRLEVRETNGQTILVDRDGGIRRDGQQSKLAREDMIKLVRMMHELTKNLPERQVTPRPH